jgi:hypothetical protein
VNEDNTKATVNAIDPDNEECLSEEKVIIDDYV